MPPIVTHIDLIRFEQPARDLRPEPPLGVPVYEPGATFVRGHGAVVIHTDTGVTGTYATDRGFELDGVPPLADLLIGRSALEREDFFAAAAHRSALSAHMVGLGLLDVALWDLAGRHYDAPIWELLGGSRRPLPAYASTHVADRHEDGLCSPEAFADFAEVCFERGYRAFKIHPWQHAPVSEHIACVRAVGERVGDRMALMLDPFNALRSFGDAVAVARACEEYGYRWLEDPYRDGGVSITGHARLRERSTVPLLQPEHARGVETHVDFMVGGATDYVRTDPDWDGVTGTMKIAHAAEGFGLDAELHGSGPIRRALMAATPNTNFYEIGLFHPRIDEPFHAPIHIDYHDGFDAIDAQGCVSVPTGPGLGVDYDWDWIDAHTTERRTIR